MATVIDFATRRVMPKGVPVGGMAATAQPPATPLGDARNPVFAAMARGDITWHLLQAAMAEIDLGVAAGDTKLRDQTIFLVERQADRLIDAIDTVMRIPVPTLGMHSYKVKSLKRWLGGIHGRPRQRIEPHINGWEAELAAEETRLRATLRARKTSLNGRQGQGVSA